MLWKTKVHSRVHNSPPTVRTLGQMDPFKALLCYFFNFHFNIIIRCMPTSVKLSCTFMFLEGRRDVYFPSSTRSKIFLKILFGKEFSVEDKSQSGFWMKKPVFSQPFIVVSICDVQIPIHGEFQNQMLRRTKRQFLNLWAVLGRSSNDLKTYAI
jgi:hypothetical protein